MAEVIETRLAPAILTFMLALSVVSAMALTNSGRITGDPIDSPIPNGDPINSPIPNGDPIDSPIPNSGSITGDPIDSPIPN